MTSLAPGNLTALEQTTLDAIGLREFCWVHDATNGVMNIFSSYFITGDVEMENPRHNTLLFKLLHNAPRLYAIPGTAWYLYTWRIDHVLSTPDGDLDSWCIGIQFVYSDNMPSCRDTCLAEGHTGTGPFAQAAALDASSIATAASEWKSCRMHEKVCTLLARVRTFDYLCFFSNEHPHDSWAHLFDAGWIVPDPFLPNGVSNSDSD